MTYCTLYHRDPGFAALAEAELTELGGGSPSEPGLWLSPRPISWAACGYGIAGGRVLASAPTLDELCVEVRALHLVASRFVVEARFVPRRRKGSTLAKARVADCIDGDVSVDHPLERFLVVASSQGFRLLADCDATPGEADWLGASHRPHNYVVAVPVRLAKAMLNLTARPGDSVLDPFCGTGTIPLLAAWAGHPSFGSDISPACVGRAAENLAHFGLTATLTRADARTVEQKADCIVTNLPYGVYSHLAPDALRAVLRNLRRLAPRATFVTSERLEEVLRAEGFDVVRVIPVESDRFERFVYVTRVSGG